MTYYPDRATGLVVEALVPRACGKSIGGWHNRLYNITRNICWADYTSCAQPGKGIHRWPG